MAVGALVRHAYHDRLITLARDHRYFEALTTNRPPLPLALGVARSEVHGNGGVVKDARIAIEAGTPFTDRR